MNYNFVPLHDLTPEQWDKYFHLYSSGSNPWYNNLADLKEYYLRKHDTAIFSRIYFIYKNNKIIGNLIFNVCSAQRPEDASVYTGSIVEACPELKLYLLKLIIRSLEEYGKDKMRMEVRYKILKQLFTEGNIKLLKKMNYYSIDIDDTIIQRYKQIAADNEDRLKQFKIMYYTSIPENMIAGYCSLFTEFVRQVPGMNEGDLSYVYTPEEYKKVERDGIQNGWTSFYMLVYDTNNEVAGMLSTVYNPPVKSVMHIITALKEKYRGIGAAKYLKALLYTELLNRTPEIQRISTQNYETNTVINKINLDMGFEIIQEELEFDVTIDALKDLYCKMASAQEVIEAA